MMKTHMRKVSIFLIYKGKVKNWWKTHSIRESHVIFILSTPFFLNLSCSFISCFTTPTSATQYWLTTTAGNYHTDYCAHYHVIFLTRSHVLSSPPSYFPIYGGKNFLSHVHHFHRLLIESLTVLFPQRSSSVLFFLFPTVTKKWVHNNNTAVDPIHPHILSPTFSRSSTMLYYSSDYFSPFRQLFTSTLFWASWKVAKFSPPTTILVLFCDWIVYITHGELAFISMLRNSFN